MVSKEFGRDGGIMVEKKIQGYYIDSVKYGKWTEWMENGEKYSEMFYNNGSIIYLKNCIKDNCD